MNNKEDMTGIHRRETTMRDGENLTNACQNQYEQISVGFSYCWSRGETLKVLIFIGGSMDE
jgi:hypothetical protein